MQPENKTDLVNKKVWAAIYHRLQHHINASPEHLEPDDIANSFFKSMGIKEKSVEVYNSKNELQLRIPIGAKDIVRVVDDKNVSLMTYPAFTVTDVKMQDSPIVAEKKTQEKEQKNKALTQQLDMYEKFDDAALQQSWLIVMKLVGLSRSKQKRIVFYGSLAPHFLVYKKQNPEVLKKALEDFLMSKNMNELSNGSLTQSRKFELIGVGQRMLRRYIENAMTWHQQGKTQSVSQDEKDFTDCER